jgi:hypothetical protein
MHRSKFASLVAAFLLAPGPAFAADEEDADKYTFFSQPSATRAQVLAHYEECRDLASMVQPPQAGNVYSPSIAGAAAAGFVQGLIKGAQRRHMFDAALRKCMSVNGYERYAMTKDEAKLLYDGEWEVVRERLADKALAPTSGKVRLEP